MPFKIVSTRRKGRVELSTVPDVWENKGKLWWPKRNGELLAKDENVLPYPDWQTFSCVVKRRNFLTYEEAEYELTRMLNSTDTDETDNGERSQINTSLSQIKDFNSMAEILISAENSSNIQQLSNPVQHARGVNSQTYDYDIMTESPRHEIEELPTLQISAGNSNKIQQLSSAVIHACGINGQTYDIIAEGPREEMVDLSLPQVQHVNVTNTTTPLDLSSLLIRITENQNKIMKKLGEISVQLSEIKDGTPVVTTLGKAKGYQTKKFIMDPINKVEDLEKLEKQLSNPEIYSNLLEKYSILCSAVSGSGTNCAYRLLDTLFTKDFLCKCSWTGGSRGVEVKIGFKGYKNILNFFFEMIRSWDCTYTIQSNEDFFKTVLRNAMKRKETKNIRTSSKKQKRTLNINNDSKENRSNEGEEKTNKEGEDNTNSNKKDNANNNSTNNNMLRINNGNINHENEAEEDESLC